MVAIKNYLQDGLNPQSKNAKAAAGQLWSRIGATKGLAGAIGRATFKVHNYDFITMSIVRCFIGKATPWEIQETLMLASYLGIVNADSVQKYCDDNLGVDCGGFVAAYWGIGCPHMASPRPVTGTGYKPRTIWGMINQRRKKASDVQTGDAAIFFDGNFSGGLDVLAKKKVDGTYDLTSGTIAFHIGLVNMPNCNGNSFTNISMADSSGSESTLAAVDGATGGNGVRTYALPIDNTGHANGYVYAQSGKKRVYFVAPPPGAGAETAWAVPASGSISSYLGWES